MTGVITGPWLSVLADVPPAPPSPPAKCCGVCRWSDPRRELCIWADQNPMPLGLPFWLDRPSLVYVDAAEGRDCEAFEPRPLAEEPAQ